MGVDAGQVRAQRELERPGAAGRAGSPAGAAVRPAGIPCASPVARGAPRTAILLPPRPDAVRGAAPMSSTSGRPSARHAPWRRGESGFGGQPHGPPTGPGTKAFRTGQKRCGRVGGKHGAERAARGMGPPGFETASSASRRALRTSGSSRGVTAGEQRCRLAVAQRPSIPRDPALDGSMDFAQRSGAAREFRLRRLPIRSGSDGRRGGWCAHSGIRCPVGSSTVPGLARPRCGPCRGQRGAPDTASRTEGSGR